MDLKKEWKALLTIPAVFLLFYFLPVDSSRFTNAVFESLQLAKWYAREHVILCLLPALFIAGAIGSFISQQSVLRLLGPQAKKFISFGVASVSGTVLAVCSCTILPLFSGIYRMGAGIGPATAFLYAGPAINILAIILTARILGVELGLARAICAVIFSVVIGLTMHFLFFKPADNNIHIDVPKPSRPYYQTILFFLSMISILIIANWAPPQHQQGLWFQIYENKWIVTSGLSILFSIILMIWFQLPKSQIIIAVIAVTALSFTFSTIPEIGFTGGIIALCLLLAQKPGENGTWFRETWFYAKLILPLLLFGVLIAGFLLGRPGHIGIIPDGWVSSLVGGNSLFSNFAASFIGAFMYFATLTEIPILQGLMENGMGKGPALALLLAGPAVSLPNMLVINSVLGLKKTLTFLLLVIVMATLSGLIFGHFFNN